jgi:hypothetical protein
MRSSLRFHGSFFSCWKFVEMLFNAKGIQYLRLLRQRLPPQNEFSAAATLGLCIPLAKKILYTPNFVSGRPHGSQNKAKYELSSIPSGVWMIR